MLPLMLYSISMLAFHSHDNIKIQSCSVCFSSKQISRSSPHNAYTRRSSQHLSG